MKSNLQLVIIFVMVFIGLMLWDRLVLRADKEASAAKPVVAAPKAEPAQLGM